MCAGLATAALATGTNFLLVGVDPLTIAGLPGEAGWRMAPLFVLMSYFLAGTCIQMWLPRIRFDARAAALAVPVFIVSGGRMGIGKRWTHCGCIMACGCGGGGPQGPGCGGCCGGA